MKGWYWIHIKETDVWTPAQWDGTQWTNTDTAYWDSAEVDVNVPIPQPIIACGGHPL